MAFVTDNHDAVFQAHMGTLLNDMGRSITIYKKAVGDDCPWCIFDTRTNRSSGKPSPGYDWSTHPDYDGVGLACPNCKNLGVVNATSTLVIDKVIIQDIGGEQYVEGKPGFFPIGTKKLYGKLSEILKDPTNLDSKTYLDPSESVKILIDGEDFKVASLNRLGIKTRYLFEAVVVKTDVLEN